MLERDRPAPFHVRLIEHREGEPRACRYEQRVKKIGAAVQRRVPRSESDANRIRARYERRRGNDDVSVDVVDSGRRAVGIDRLYVVAARLKIQYQRSGGIF